MKISYLKQKFRKSENYKGVRYRIYKGKYIWFAHNATQHKECATEKLAAMQYDIWLIEKGKKPVNVLKPVNKAV